MSSARHANALMLALPAQAQPTRQVRAGRGVVLLPEFTHTHRTRGGGALISARAARFALVETRVETRAAHLRVSSSVRAARSHRWRYPPRPARDRAQIDQGAGG